MKRPWKDYKGAIDRLKDYAQRNSAEEITRAEASEVMGMSNSVFSREVKNNSLFLAYYSPRITSRGTYYKIADLLDHLERLDSRPQDVAELFYYRYCKPGDFGERYPGKTINDVFSPGTYLILGGEN